MTERGGRQRPKVTGRVTVENKGRARELGEQEKVLDSGVCWEPVAGHQERRDR